MTRGIFLFSGEIIYRKMMQSVLIMLCFICQTWRHLIYLTTQQQMMELCQQHLTFLMTLNFIYSSLSQALCQNYRALMPYFIRMAERINPFVDLNLEECKLTCNGVKRLLQVLSSFKKPLNSLRIGDNNLGRFAWHCTSLSFIYILLSVQF